jgi:hypothetical protein
MGKLTLTQVATAYESTQAINANYSLIEAAIENTLSRDGTTPNSMNANIDMNGYSILNQADIDMNGHNILNQGNPISIVGWEWEGPWLTSTTYSVGDVIQESGSAYICIVAHTSGTFATDLASIYWQLVAQANLPSQTGQVGKSLITDGSAPLWSTRVTPVTNKAAAVLITPVVDSLLYIDGTDGGLFKAVTGAAAATYSDNGGTYCGTQFIPTGGDGSTAWLRVDGGYNVGLPYNVKWFGAAGDGSTDDTASFRATVLAASSSKMYIPESTYDLRWPSGTVLPLLTAITIVGDGRGKTILQFTGTTSNVNAFDLRADDITMKDFTIELQASAAAPIGIGFGASLSDATFDNIEIDGTPTWDTVDTNNSFGIKPSDTFTQNRVTFTNCHIHDTEYGLFTGTSFVGTNRGWIFDSCHFYNNTGDDLEFNTSDLAAENWNGVVVDGCTFVDHPTPGANSFAIGTDSGQEIIITNNIFKDYTSDSAVHIEDYIRSVKVSDNIFENCNIGIEMFNVENSFVSITGNLLDGDAGNALDLDPSTLADPSTTLNNNTIGIVSQRPTSGTNANCSISANTINNYDVGISCPEGFDSYISDNIVSLCKLAYSFSESGTYNFSNNTASRCKYVMWGNAFTAVVSDITMDKCTNLLFSTSANFVINKGITVTKNTGSLTTGVTSNVILFEQPTRAWGNECSSIAVQDDLKSNIGTASHLYTDDGTTLTATRNMSYTSGTVTISNPSLANVTSNLCAQVFNNVGSAKSFDIVIHLPTMLVFN